MNFLYNKFFVSMKLFCCYCERRREARKELAVVSFLPQSYGKSQQQDISESIDSFW